MSQNTSTTDHHHLMIDKTQENNGDCNHDELLVLQKKLQNLQNVEKHFPVNLKEKLDFTISPKTKYTSFPYFDFTPYCQPLTTLQQINNEFPFLKNESFDVSSENLTGDKNCQCIVTRSIFVNNSHAGSHADQPQHFVKNPKIIKYRNEHYNGSCLIIDLCEFVKNTQESPFGITKEQITNYLQKNKITKFENIFRILLKTKINTLDENAEWTNDFYFLLKETSSFLVETFPNLILIGIDTPSIDNPSASPIYHFSHGVFYNKGVAILENLNLQSFNGEENCMFGYLMTVFNNLQESEDAIGCSCFYFPSKELTNEFLN
ncbi:hypothetical protein ABK040_006022 [Willaertia magna]